MPRKERTALAAGATALVVAGVLGGMQVIGDEGSSPPRSAAASSHTSRQPENDKETGSNGRESLAEATAFTVTYVPDGFRVVNRTGPAELPGQKSGPDIMMRSVKYNNMSGGNAKSSAGRAAAFGVTVTAGGDVSTTLRRRANKHPDARWIQVHGHRALVQERGPDRGLAIITWNVRNVQVAVVGKGMGVDEILPVAKGVRIR